MNIRGKRKLTTLETVSILYGFSVGLTGLLLNKGYILAGLILLVVSALPFLITIFREIYFS